MAASLDQAWLATLDPATAAQLQHMAAAQQHQAQAMPAAALQPVQQVAAQDWAAYQMQAQAQALPNATLGSLPPSKGKGKGPGGPVQEEGDWPCPQCGNINFRRRDKCNRCGFDRPPEFGGNDKGKKGKSKGKGKGKKEDVPSSNLYITGLPKDWTNDNLTTFFSQFGTILSSRVLPVQPNKPSAAGFVRVSVDEAEWLVKNLDSTANAGYVPEGMTGPITLTIVEDSGKGKDGKGKSGKGKDGWLVADEVNETDNLYVKGLPAEMTEERFGEIFAQYGSVVQKKLLPSSPLPGKPIVNQAGFVRYSSVEEARHIIGLLNNQIPHGLARKVQVGFAGDGVPQVKKMAAKAEGGEEIKYGVVRTYDVSHQSGFVVAADIFRESGQEVYAHKTCLDRCHAGPGDTVMFFVFWKSEKPQASNPMLRIGADQSEGGKACALKGWYKGQVKDKNFGFLESAEMKLLFGKDVYVSQALAEGVEPGWVSFNCTLQKDMKDKKLTATATYMENCEESWKPGAADLSKTREVEGVGGKGTAKGGGCDGGMGDCWGGMDDWGSGGCGDSWGCDNWVDQWNMMMMMNMMAQGGCMGGWDGCGMGMDMGMGGRGGKGGKGKGGKDRKGKSQPALKDTSAGVKRPADGDHPEAPEAKARATE